MPNNNDNPNNEEIEDVKDLEELEDDEEDGDEDLEDFGDLDDFDVEFEDVDDEDLEDDEEEILIVEPEGMDSEEKVRLMALVADSVKAEQIIVLDLRGLTIIADFFLICSGNTSIQIRGIADRIEEKLREVGIKKLRMEGFQDASWILMDYSDVVVHIMSPDQRAFYRLEERWSDAPHLQLELLPE